VLMFTIKDIHMEDGDPTPILVSAGALPNCTPPKFGLVEPLQLVLPLVTIENLEVNCVLVQRIWQNQVRYMQQFYGGVPWQSHYLSSF
jgi:hypothetical protein